MLQRHAKTSREAVSASSEWVLARERGGHQPRKDGDGEFAVGHAGSRDKPASTCGGIDSKLGLHSRKMVAAESVTSVAGSLSFRPGIFALGAS